jgi:hypothetical protein
MQAAAQLVNRLISNSEFSESFRITPSKDSVEGFRQVRVEALDCVIPAWRAGIQVDTISPEASMQTWLRI